MAGKNEVADIYGSEIYDIPRQRSRCKILIYSHIIDNPDDKDYAGILDCSRDVIQCETSKTIKSGGGASFTLVPRRSYLNFVYPNDYVPISFDPGDGRGFMRSFFGFVDRCERQIQTSDVGQTITRYQITCSDFTKAFDNTNIYFNPHITKRGDFVAQHFAGSDNVGGAALRTKGISIWGTPADIVMSLSTLLLGFGSQFALPPKQPVSEILVDVSRRKRLKLALSQLSSDYQTLWGKGDLSAEKARVEARLSQLRSRSVDELLDPRRANFAHTYLQARRPGRFAVAGDEATIEHRPRTAARPEGFAVG